MAGGPLMPRKYRSRRARLAALSASLRAQGWTWTEIGHRIAREENVNTRVAMRLAHGMTQVDVAGEWNALFPAAADSAGMGDKRISYWESWPIGGYEPSLKSLKRLARIYQCGVGDLMDDGDFTYLDGNARHARSATAVAIREATGHQAPGSTGDRVTFSPVGLASEDEDDMQRRVFLAGLAPVGAAGLGVALEGTRHTVGLALTERHATTDIEEWREIAQEYGHTYRTTAPSELIKTLLVDIWGLRGAMERYRDEGTASQLRAIGAMLSTFTAQTVADLGHVRESRRWWRTARRAADESGDRYTMVWVRGREIMRANYEQRPVATTLRLVGEAESRIDSAPTPCGALPEFLNGKAQTLARIGEPATAEAEATLIRLRRAVDALPAPLKTDNSLFSFGEWNLRYTECLVYTHLRDAQRATAAECRTLELTPADEFGHRAGIELLHAFRAVSAGDVADGLRGAQATVTRLSTMHQVQPVVDLAHKVLLAVPVGEQHRPSVAGYRDCLAASFTTPAPALSA